MIRHEQYFRAVSLHHMSNVPFRSDLSNQIRIGKEGPHIFIHIQNVGRDGLDAGGKGILCEIELSVASLKPPNAIAYHRVSSVLFWGHWPYLLTCAKTRWQNPSQQIAAAESVHNTINNLRINCH